TETAWTSAGMSEPATARGRRLRERGMDQERPTIDTWQDPPFNRWTFSHVDEFVTSVSISTGRERSQKAVNDLDAFSGTVPELERRLAQTWTDAILVVHEDRIVGEWYGDGSHPDDRHLLMSVSKSICGIVVGALDDDGLIEPSRTVAHYIPELAESAYGTATVQQVLDMTVAVEYLEEYADLNSHVRAHDRVAGWRTRFDSDPRDTHEFLMGLRPAGEHGKAFQYCSANTDVLAWLVEVVTGKRYHEVVGERVWSRLDAQSDARITVDSSGFAFANGGISCTARDLAGVGRLMLAGGEFGGRRIVSDGWVRATMAGGDPEAARGLPYQDIHPNGSYKNHWWATGNERGSVYAVGIHGQYVWLDPPTRTVIVKFSSAPEALGRTMNSDHARLFQELCAALE
ncbi:MAG TPA: serine hydrolase, partial [Terrimesophilobacter sp.]|nr:serine hydrolase [Terrimesophilobacter sp.]